MSLNDEDGLEAERASLLLQEADLKRQLESLQAAQQKAEGFDPNELHHEVLRAHGNQTAAMTRARRSAVKFLRILVGNNRVWTSLHHWRTNLHRAAGAADISAVHTEQLKGLESQVRQLSVHYQSLQAQLKAARENTKLKKLQREVDKLKQEAESLWGKGSLQDVTKLCRNRAQALPESSSHTEFLLERQRGGYFDRNGLRRVRRYKHLEDVPMQVFIDKFLEAARGEQADILDVVSAARRAAVFSTLDAHQCGEIVIMASDARRAALMKSLPFQKRKDVMKVMADLVAYQSMLQEPVAEEGTDRSPIAAEGEAVAQMLSRWNHDPESSESDDYGTSEESEEGPY